jgi:hypothetical protein
MSRITLDPAVVAQLDQTREIVEVCDISGRLVGWFSPVTAGINSIRASRSPNSREDLERLRREAANSKGRTTAEVLERLEKLASASEASN